MEMKEYVITADFKYKPHYASVKGSKIHYIDEGRGEPVLFLHGMPTWSYLWRNIIPALTDTARCIAPDLIGMGKSGKPDIAYTVKNHIHYMEEFIDTLDLHNITLVLHGFGSLIGLYYAMQYPQRIRGLVFYESHIHTGHDEDILSLPVRHFASMLSDVQASYRAVIKDNYVVNHLLPASVLRELTHEEMEHYREPFQTPSSRKVLWQYIQELSAGHLSKEVLELMEDYTAKLRKSSVPKLFLYAIPGFFTTVSTLQWCRTNLSSLTITDLGEALHFAQETLPFEFANALSTWYRNTFP